MEEFPHNQVQTHNCKRKVKRKKQIKVKTDYKQACGNGKCENII